MLVCMTASVIDVMRPVLSSVQACYYNLSSFMHCCQFLQYNIVSIGHVWTCDGNSVTISFSNDFTISQGPKDDFYDAIPVSYLMCL